MAQDDTKATEPDIKSASDPNMTAAATEAADKELSAELAAGYGTRSRNRTGNARPNYAEDRDYDVDMFDHDHDKTHQTSKKASRQSNAASQSDGAQANASARKASGDDSRAGTSQNGSKEHTPGGATGSSSAAQAPNGTSQPSRKRKATGSAQQGSSSSSSNNAATTLSRRAVASTENSTASQWTGTNLLTFTNSRARLQQGRLVADDGTALEANDHVYLVCEPPGEPYYLGRIMEFLHPQNDKSKPIDALRINWYYRPRDIGRKAGDTRTVFATMHSDISPLTALRGKCQIKHRVEIDNMDEYRRTPDCFWFEKLYDRYIQKNYDLIPTSKIINVPEKVKKVLDDRWRFVLVEQGRGKELTSAVKTCKRCSGYCASNNSVDCAHCQNTFHMDCVRPPLLKKPARGFGWSCAACSRAQERKLEARHTPNLREPHGDAEEEELLEEEEEDVGADTVRSSPVAVDDDDHHGTEEQRYNASLWPWRYLGMHCKPEDALDYDDRIYPRASTRIGPRHQAPVGPWPGRPVHYVKPPEKKKGKKQEALRAAEEAQAAELYPDGKRPKWVQDMPPGYTARGEDPIDPDDPNATSQLLWKPPTTEEDEKKVDTFMKEARGMAKGLGLPERSTQLQDVALRKMFRKNYNADEALKALAEADKKEFDEPSLSANEFKKFEDGVTKYGSEIFLIKRHVKSMTAGHVTRYYYTWKKTERGQSIWSNFPGRKGKKEAKRAEAAVSKLADDVADHEDDSAFDSVKATEKKRSFMCQYCSTTSSRRWRRAPNAAIGLVNELGAKASNKDKGIQYVVALCTRCAELWRRYAVRWEDVEEMQKKVNAAGKVWRRKQDEELIKELQAADAAGRLTPERHLSPVDGAANGQEPARKKLKASDKDIDSDSSSAVVKKLDKSSEPPVMPEMPKPRTLPCAVCQQLEPYADIFTCRECRLSVHKDCYGITDGRMTAKWTCDMCLNDKNPQVSTSYKCVLCPVEHTEQELIEQPKLTHHKKKMSEKDRERERLEVQQARKALDLYRKKQEDLSRPLNPREALKRTADNNWVHVTCAVITPEVKFGNAKALEPSEGIPSIQRTKYEEVCQVCNGIGGACLACLSCRAFYHVECARRQGHVLAFEIIPVKSSRRDQAHIQTFNGESGVMAPGIWCKDHVPKKNIHYLHELSEDSGCNALQVYVQHYKQADLDKTGTVRKANLMTEAAKTAGTAAKAGLRRQSTVALTNGGGGHIRANGASIDPAEDALQPGDKVCISCGVDVSPRWWSIDSVGSPFHAIFGKLSNEAEKFASQRKFQCHKCHADHRPMKPPSPSPERNFEPREPSRPANEPSMAATASATASVMGAPEQSPRAVEHRETQPRSYMWSTQARANPSPLPPPPTTNPIDVNTHGPRPLPGSSKYFRANVYPSAPPPAPGSQSVHAVPAPPPYGEWTRPSSQHGSPPARYPHPHETSPPMGSGPHLHHMGPGGNPSSLRPPSLSGPPPSGPPPVSGHLPAGAHGPPLPYTNGLPPSPRRASGAAPPSPYTSPYVQAPLHSGPPPLPPSHGPLHGLSNGSVPGHDVHSHGYPPPPRGPYPASLGSPHEPRAVLYRGREHHGSRPHEYAASRGHEHSVSAGSNVSRPGSDGRPSSGASANPSLRNLLS